ncbi:hypothetical protein HDV04_005181 [Boothiomyces sp. JEL0838]|nr:hypothetical protein HDV04_005181 [Boothiomyces sp. JEL0838]
MKNQSYKVSFDQKLGIAVNESNNFPNVLVAIFVLYVPTIIRMLDYSRNHYCSIFDAFSIFNHYGWFMYSVAVVPLIGLALFKYSSEDARHTMKSQECTINEKDIHFKGGLFYKDKIVPLDKIQEITIERNRYGKAIRLDIQTAGYSSPESPDAEVKLIAPLNAEQVRAEILSRREAMLSSVPTQNVMHEILEELRQIKFAFFQRLEKEKAE